MIETLFKGMNIPASWKCLEKQLKPYSPDEILVSYEAGYFGYKLHDLVQASCMQCLVAAPSLIPQTAGNRVKTDRKDALKLAVFAANSQLAPVWVPPIENREERQLIRQRSQFMDQRRRLQNQIKSFLSFHGVEIEENSSWSNEFIQYLLKLKLSQRLRFNLNLYLKSWHSLSLILEELGQEIKNFANGANY